MPKSIIYTANQGALTTSVNLLAGDVNEFVPYDAEIYITSVSSAIGMKLSVFADTDLIVDDKEIPFIGTTLVDKDHVIGSFVVEAGTRLAIRGRETANVATTDYYLGVEVVPV
jgi:hypothetical protein